MAPDDTADDALERLESRLDELKERPLPLLDPAPSGRYRVASAMPPEHYEAAVARATELIKQGKLEKIVLAREVQTHAPQDYDPAAVLGVLREAFPACFCFCVGRGDATLVAASPELLVRREGHRVSTLALAGSTRRCCATIAIARSTRSSRAGSNARCAITRCGWPRRPSRSSSRSPTSSIWRPQSERSWPPRSTRWSSLA
jgi:anthranilate/para-aminobenzoate synthase component I